MGDHIRCQHRQHRHLHQIVDILIHKLHQSIRHHKNLGCVAVPAHIVSAALRRGTDLQGKAAAVFVFDLQSAVRRIQIVGRYISGVFQRCQRIQRPHLIQQKLHPLLIQRYGGVVPPLPVPLLVFLEAQSVFLVLIDQLLRSGRDKLLLIQRAGICLRLLPAGCAHQHKRRRQHQQIFLHGFLLLILQFFSDYSRFLSKMEVPLYKVKMRGDLPPRSGLSDPHRWDTNVLFTATVRLMSEDFMLPKIVRMIVNAFLPLTSGSRSCSSASTNSSMTPERVVGSKL